MGLLSLLGLLGLLAFPEREVILTLVGPGSLTDLIVYRVPRG